MPDPKPKKKDSAPVLTANDWEKLLKRGEQDARVMDKIVRDTFCDVHPWAPYPNALNRGGIP